MVVHPRQLIHHSRRLEVAQGAAREARGPDGPKSHCWSSIAPPLRVASRRGDQRPRWTLDCLSDPDACSLLAEETARFRAEKLRQVLTEFAPTSIPGLFGPGDLNHLVEVVLSRRRTAIETEMERQGASSAKAAGRGPSGPALCDIEPGNVAPTLARRVDRTLTPAQIPAPGIDEATTHRLVQELLAPDGLTAQSSAFRRRDVVREISDRLPHDAPAQAIEKPPDSCGAPPRSSPSQGRAHCSPGRCREGWSTRERSKWEVAARLPSATTNHDAGPSRGPEFAEARVTAFPAHRWTTTAAVAIEWA